MQFGIYILNAPLYFYSNIDSATNVDGLSSSLFSGGV